MQKWITNQLNKETRLKKSQKRLSQNHLAKIILSYSNIKFFINKWFFFDFFFLSIRNFFSNSFITFFRKIFDSVIFFFSQIDFEFAKLAKLFFSLVKMFIFIINNIIDATNATIETIANVVHIDVTTQLTSTINIDKNNVNVINTNANMSATNELARNEIHISAINESTSIINIDESNVSVINTNINTNVKNKIVSNKKNDNKEKKNVVTIESNDNQMRFDNFCKSKNTNTIEQNSNTIKTRNLIAIIKFITIFCKCHAFVFRWSSRNAWLIERVLLIKKQF